jgi:ubiquinone biosynthesis protein
VQVVRGDLKIIRRQIKALRYIKPFLSGRSRRTTARKAQIVAKMVREFGPFFHQDGPGGGRHGQLPARGNRA